VVFFINLNLKKEERNMNAIMMALRAFFIELEEASKTILLGTNYHKLMNQRIVEQQVNYFEEEDNIEFDPETLEINFVD
jgi:hypothetical protein